VANQAPLAPLVLPVPLRVWGPQPASLPPLATRASAGLILAEDAFANCPSLVRIGVHGYGWARARAFARMRHVALYWHERAGATGMRRGGAWALRDQCDFEADEHKRGDGKTRQS
jgi:hypothetical protein